MRIEVGEVEGAVAPARPLREREPVDDDIHQR
jgi:hypothetical protein